MSAVDFARASASTSGSRGVNLHTNPFPEDLYLTLRQQHPDLPLGTPKFESHHANLSLRRQLTDKLSILARKQKNLQDGNYKLQYELQKKQDAVKKAIDWIEAWGAAEKQQRDTAKKAGKVLPSVGRPSIQKRQESKQPMDDGPKSQQNGSEQKVEKMSVMARARKEGITVIATVIYKNLNEVPEEEISNADQGMKVIFDKLPYSTKLSAILQALGATDSSADYLDFSLNPKEVGRNNLGAPINFPANMRRIGWGCTTLDGRKVKLIDMLSHVKEGAEHPVLKCRLFRMWTAVELFNVPGPKFKSIPEPENIQLAQSRLMFNCNRLITQQQQNKGSFEGIYELLREMHAEIATYAEATAAQQQSGHTAPKNKEARRPSTIGQERKPFRRPPSSPPVPQIPIQKESSSSKVASKHMESSAMRADRNRKIPDEDVGRSTIPERSDSSFINKRIDNEEVLHRDDENRSSINTGDTNNESPEQAEQLHSEGEDGPILNFKFTANDDKANTGYVVVEQPAEYNAVPIITPSPSLPTPPETANSEAVIDNHDTRSDSSSNSTIVVTLKASAPPSVLPTIPTISTTAATSSDETKQQRPPYGGKRVEKQPEDSIDEPNISYTPSAYAEARAISFDFGHGGCSDSHDRESRGNEGPVGVLAGVRAGDEQPRNLVPEQLSTPDIIGGSGLETRRDKNTPEIQKIEPVEEPDSSIIPHTAIAEEVDEYTKNAGAYGEDDDDDEPIFTFVLKADPTPLPAAAAPTLFEGDNLISFD